jgi:hypothetical protein
VLDGTGKKKDLNNLGAKIAAVDACIAEKSENIRICRSRTEPIPVHAVVPA